MKRVGKVLKSLFVLIGAMIAEIYHAVVYFLKSNLYVFGQLIEIGTPYFMWYIVVEVYKERGYFAIGGEMFIPLFLFFISGVIKKLSNIHGTGYEIPVANKRFTIEEEYGEVTIAEEDIQEVILYLNDVENYIEKRGLNKW